MTETKTIDQRDIFSSRDWRGWKAETPDDGSGYYIVRPGQYPLHSRVAGWAADGDTARKLLASVSGIDYDLLPTVNRKDVRLDHQERVPISTFPKRNDCYYQDVFVYLHDNLLGKITTRQMARSTTLMTFSFSDQDGNRGCILGADLRWLLRVHGYRLVG